MHTILVLALGFALFIICIFVGRFAGGSKAAMRKAALAFLPLWLVGAGINMAVGVLNAGYTVREETPTFFIVFCIPALAALIFWWKSRKAALTR